MGAGRVLMRATIHLTFRDGTEPKDIILGAFAQIAAKRHFGLEVVKSGDSEVALFGAFVEIAGPAGAKDPDAFDNWLMTVDDITVISEEVDPENPSEAETPSSEPSDDSPPTSD